ncbi:FMN-binding protein [Butyrivibrio sp. MC2013]|uniref:FMN-binding protein n=1 Tax=Butyrivibrio sp. MC2013 TaxID=1280686 RepID=UPI000411A844|nr:FMN-binding protein [Butyrivibrio sp. MC2013]
MSTNSAAAGRNEGAEMIKNALILFVITLIAGILLGMVYQVTKEPIAQQEALKVENANKAVFAEAASFGEESVLDEAEKDRLLLSDEEFSGVNIDSVLEAYDASGALEGYVMQITSKGYGDEIVFSMGVDLEGELNGISLISINETPGLGMNAEKVLVPQYSEEGLAASPDYSIVKDGSGKANASDTAIEAISGATITSKAVNRGVNAGLLYYSEILKGGH